MIIEETAKAAGLFIDGKWQPGEGEIIKSVNPTTGE